MLVNKDNLLVYTLIQSDQHNVRGEFDKAIQLLTDYLAGQIDNVHDVAICAYTLSESYRLKEDTEKEKEYLILSSIADMKSAVREYISLDVYKRQMRGKHLPPTIYCLSRHVVNPFEGVPLQRQGLLRVK